MGLKLDSIECVTWSLNRPVPIQTGMAFYEIELPAKYYVFDKIFVFSNINLGASSGKVYFASANSKFKNKTPDDYLLASNVKYEGFKQAVENKEQSTICICDPGHFIEGIVTSWYGVIDGVDICYYIAQFLSYWFKSASLKSSQVLIFGSSAGSFGALRTAAFLESKTNVISVNGQIIKDYKYKDNKHEHNLIDFYQESLKKNRVIPNIYMLCNYRDKTIFLNRIFFDLLVNYPYEDKGVHRPNIVLDLYDGINGHLRPRKDNLLQKIDIAEAVLKSSQDEQDFQRNEELKNDNSPSPKRKFLSVS